MPLARESCDVVWSNFALQFVDDLPALFAEWSRVLKVGGVLMFTAPGPDTMIELRRAINWRATMLHAGYASSPTSMTLATCWYALAFADPVMDMEVITLEYASADALWRDLRAMGLQHAGCPPARADDAATACCQLLQRLTPGGATVGRSASASRWSMGMPGRLLPKRPRRAWHRAHRRHPARTAHDEVTG